MKRFSFLMCVVLLMNLTIYSFGSENYNPKYVDEVNLLHQANLYLGISKTMFDPDLGSLVDRQTAIIILLRILNYEDKSKEMPDNEVNSILEKYSDSNKIALWAKNQVAFAIKQGILKGFPDNTIRPEDKMNSKMMCTLCLKELGYSFNYNEAPSLFVNYCGLEGTRKSDILDTGFINKDVLVLITFKALSINYYNSDKTIGQRLINEGKPLERTFY